MAPIERLTSKLGSTPASVCNSSAAFLDYLEDRLPANQSTSEFQNALKACRACPPEQQIFDLAPVFLLWERDLTAGRARRTIRMEIRSVLERKFPELLACPEFGLIFTRQRPQECFLCRIVLAATLRNALEVTDRAGSESVAHLIAWIENASDVRLPVPFDLRPTIPGPNSEWIALSYRIAHELFLAWEKSLGESVAQSFFERAYDSAAVRYSLLDTFPNVGNLLPPGLLDSDKMNQLSRSQLQQLFLRSLHDSNFHHIRLAEQNEKLDALHKELEVAHANLERRVSERTSQLENANTQLRTAKERAEIADRAKSEFLANMSHELRTPLNAILGFSEMIQSAVIGPVDLRYRNYASDIHKSGQHLLAIINDILDLSKLESGKFELRDENVHIANVLETCQEMILGSAHESGIDISFDLGTDLPVIRADELRLKQIVINLLSNAVKFTPAGGRVVVTVNQDEMSDVVIEVRDTGIGMRAEDISVALEPFGQVGSQMGRAAEGTGLGLPLVKYLTELHGGQFTIVSELGVGTTATVRLPASRVVTPASRVAL